MIYNGQVTVRVLNEGLLLDDVALITSKEIV